MARWSPAWHSPRHCAAFAAAAIIPRIDHRARNATLSVVGAAAMLIGTFWISRISVHSTYLTGIAIPIVIFGIGQGLGLSTLTNAGLTGVAPVTPAQREGWSTSRTTSVAPSASEPL